MNNPTGVIYVLGWGDINKSKALNLIDDLNQGKIDESQIRDLINKPKFSNATEPALKLHSPAISQFISTNIREYEPDSIKPYHCDYCPFSNPTHEREYIQCELLSISEVLAKYPKCTHQDWIVKIIEELKPVIERSEYLDSKAREIMTRMVYDFYHEAKETETVAQFKERYLSNISPQIREAIDRIARKELP